MCLALLLLTNAAWSQPIGTVMFSTTGAGEGTLLEASYLAGPPRVVLTMTWKGRGPKAAKITLNRAQVDKLASGFETAVTSRDPGDIEVATSAGSTLAFQNQSDGTLHVTVLLLKPPGTKSWNEWVAAQVNLEKKEEEAFRQLIRKMQARLKG